MVNFKYCLIMFYMDLNIAHMFKWRSLRDQFIDRDDFQPSGNIRKPKGFIVFVVDRSLLKPKYTADRFRKTNDKYALEPYRSLHMRDSDGAPKGNKQNEEDKSVDFSREVLNGLELSKQQSEMLRRTWRSSCGRKASKVCRKACKMTYKNVCKIFRCSKSMKRRFGKDCKRNCKMKFRGNYH